MNSCESTMKRLLHRAVQLFILIFNNHKSANNRVQRNKTLKSPVGWNQAVAEHDSKWAGWFWTYFILFTPRSSSRRGFRAGEAKQCSSCLFIPADPQTKKKAYTPQSSPRLCCHFSINIPRHFWFSSKCT